MGALESSSLLHKQAIEVENIMDRNSFFAVRFFNSQPMLSRWQIRLLLVLNIVTAASRAVEISCVA